MSEEGFITLVFVLIMAIWILALLIAVTRPNDEDKDQ